MSKTIYESKKMYLHQFWGGERKGISIQIGNKEDESNYVQFNIPEVRQLIRNLNRWLAKQKLKEKN